MRGTARSIALVAFVVLAACGGDDGGGTQPQTEEAALEATVKALSGTLRNNSGDVLNFLNEECRASVDDGEVRDALLFAQLFLQSDDYDIDDIEVVGTVTEYTDTAATIEIDLQGPEGVDLGLLDLGTDEIEVVYENGKWVDEGCDFEDTAQVDADTLESDLEALGLTGTQDDPIPAGTAAPIGSGFSIVITEYIPDAYDRIVAEGGVEPFLDDGDQIGLVAFEAGYAGSDEPVRLGNISLDLVDADGVTLDSAGCGNMPNQTDFNAPEMFSGAATSAVTCFAGDPSRFPDDPLVTAQGSFSGRAVFFAPTAAGGTDTITGTSGPSPDGDLTDDRTAPAELATPVDLGSGWTITVSGLDTDALDAILDESTFNSPPPDGFTYALLDVTLAYDGDEPTASPIQVTIDLVGDSNLSAKDRCNPNASNIPGLFDRFADLVKGGSISGVLCFEVADDDLDSLVAYASADSFSDGWEFLAVR